jgi:hypothetical protein
MAYTMVTNRDIGKSLSRISFARRSTSPGPAALCVTTRTMLRVDDIRSAAAISLPDTSPKATASRPWGNCTKSYQSPPTLRHGRGEAGH